MEFWELWEVRDLRQDTGASMKAKKCCGTCEYSLFEKTPKGRIKKLSGICTYPWESIAEKIKMPANMTVSFNSTAIWKDEGEKCHCYSAKG